MPRQGKSSLADSNPELAAQWHPSKNGHLTPSDVSSMSGQRVWWKCPEGEDHEWKARVADRQKGGCPCCVGRLIVPSNSLPTTHPELMREWHPTLNGELDPSKLGAGMTKKVWWKCPAGDDHEWEAPIIRRTRERQVGCPVCAGKKVVPSRSLATTHPDIADEWHATMNGSLTPDQILAGSTKKVWWQCSEGEDHYWRTSPNSRTNKNHAHPRGCPVCSGHEVRPSTSLAVRRPKWAKQWHPKKNGTLSPDEIYFHSRRKVWWQCEHNPLHEWRAVVEMRERGGCPFCTLTPQSKQELTITFELKRIFKDIDPKGYKTMINGKLTSIDIFIPSLSLAIEFDGKYWHKDKRHLDLVKTLKLTSFGIQVLRIREEPLQRIQDIDILSPLPWQPKLVTDRCLEFIKQKCELPSSAHKMIDAYLQQDELKGERARDRYIDAVLEERASRANPGHS